MNITKDNIFLNIKHIPTIKHYMLDCNFELFGAYEYDDYDYYYDYDDDDYDTSYIREGITIFLEDDMLCYQYISENKSFEINELYIYDYDISVSNSAFYIVKNSCPHLLL